MKIDYMYLSKNVEKYLNNYLNIFKRSPIGVCILSTECKILGVNSKICEINGYSEFELIGKDGWITDSFSKENEGFQKSIAKLIQGKKVRGKDYIEVYKEYVHKKGHVLPAQTTISVIYNKKQKPILLIAMILDLSKALKNELALNRLETQLKDALESIGANITVLDLNGTVSYVNNLVPGIKKHEFIGSSIFNWLPDSTSAQIKKYLNQIQKDKKNISYKSEYIDPSGKIRYHENDMRPVFDGNKVKSVSILSNEITELQVTKEKLQRSNELMSLTLNVNGMGIWEWDVGTNQVYWGENVYKILEKDPANYTASFKGFLELLIDKDKERLLLKVSEVENIEKHEGSFRIKKKKGEKDKWISFKSNFIENKKGEITKWLGVAWDSTEEKEVERNKLKQKKMELQNSDLKQFAYLTSHDLKEPLMTISNYSDLLSTRYKDQLDEDANKCLSYLKKSVAQMDTQIKDLLAYSLLGEKKEFVSLNCNDIIREIQIALSFSINKVNCTFELEPLPTIKGNKTEIYMLFQNLISNALKFHNKNIDTIIKISSSSTKDFWKFKIEDNGIGIEEKKFKKIFVIFQRLHEKDEYEGNGIGLAHCQKIVIIHGGKIWVESEKNKGSSFYFTIAK